MQVKGDYKEAQIPLQGAGVRSTVRGTKIPVVSNKRHKEIVKMFYILLGWITQLCIKSQNYTLKRINVIRRK